jgi:hypothetical protein
MSPEQARGETVDARSDLFSLGVVLFEMLTGRSPFRRANLSETMAAILRERAPAPSSLNPRVPRALDAVVARCLEKERERRFPSATDLAEALRHRPARRRWWLGAPPLVIGLVLLLARLAPPPARLQTRALTFNNSDHPVLDAVIDPGGLSVAYRDDRGWSSVDLRSGAVTSQPPPKYEARSRDGRLAWSEGDTLFVGDGDTERRRILTLTGQALGLVTWSPDELRIAFMAWPHDRDGVYASYQDDDASLRELRLDAGGKPLAPARERGRLGRVLVNALTASRDGHRAAFISSTMQNDVFVAALDKSGDLSGEPRRFTSDLRDDYLVGFTLEARELLFTSHRQAGRDLFRQALDGEPSPRLLLPQVQKVNLAGGRLYLLASEAEAEVRPWTLSWRDLSGATSGPPVPLGAYSGELFLRCTGSRRDLCLVQQESGGRRSLFALGATIGRQIAADFGQAQLSPDGEALALSDLQHRIRVVSVADGRELVAPVVLTCSPTGMAWYPDGAALVVSCISGDTPPNRLLRVERSGAIRLLRTSASYLSHPVVSSDGKWLGFTSGEISGNVELWENP